LASLISLRNYIPSGENRKEMLLFLQKVSAPGTSFSLARRPGRYRIVLPGVLLNGTVAGKSDIPI
jgi:hypothetical protein